MTPAQLTAFKSRLPEIQSTQEPSELETFGKDWTKVHAPNPSLIVFPKTTEEVSATLKFCHENGIPVVPSGGRTGLSGGAVAARGEVVLNLSKLSFLGEVDPLSQTVRVGAGAVTEAVHEHCKPHGLTWPVDFASKGSSQVGGNIATNAGGVKVIRYGLTRNWVLGLTTVLMDGTILRLNGALEKNQSGMDLRQVFIGSEGTLGVVTEAVLKLTRLPEELDVYFFALESLPAVFNLFQEARRGPFTLMAFECLSHECLQEVLEVRKVPAPFATRSEQYVLLEIERPKSEESRAQAEEWLAGLFERGLVADGVLAQNPREARDLWILREGTAEAIMSRGMVHKHDISLPISRLKAFLDEWMGDFKSRFGGFQVFVFGHIGDGNLHVNVRKPENLSKEEFLKACVAIDDAMFPLVRKYEGSVSAEHGIGLLKRHLLKYSRTDEEIALFRGIKKLLDPKGLLNPGKIFE